MNSEFEHISPELLETIERYLLNELNEEERTAFEQRLTKSEDLRHIVSRYSTMIEGVETAALKSSLNEFHDETEASVSASKSGSSPSHQKKHPILTYLIAASILLAVGLTTWYIAPDPFSEPESLFAIYFEPDPGLIVPMSTTRQYRFYTGMIDYKRDNYAEAISKWEPLLIKKPQNDTLNYFLGMAYLARGHEQEAIPYLQTCLKAETSPFLDDAHYYLGLAYLKANMMAKAKEALQGSNKKQAAQLLSEMDMDE